jgi:predicted permease
VMFYSLIWLPLFITMGYLLSSILVKPIKKTRKRIRGQWSIESHLENAQTEKRMKIK